MEREGRSDKGRAAGGENTGERREERIRRREYGMGKGEERRAAQRSAAQKNEGKGSEEKRRGDTIR